MKKIYTLLMMLLTMIILTSCTGYQQNYFKFQHVKRGGEGYYTSVANDVTNIDSSFIKQFIDTNITYEIFFNDLRIEDNQQITLAVGDNIFIIKTEKEYKLNIKRLNVFNIYIQGIDEIVKTITINEGESLKIADIDISSFNKEGYLLTGFKEDINTVITEETTIHLVYQPTNYTIQLFYDGMMHDHDVEYQKPFNFPNITLKGHHLVSWSNINDTTKQYTSTDNYLPEYGECFKPTFAPNQYHITYNYFDKTKVVDVYYGDKIALYNPEVLGYTFNHWVNTNNEIISIEQYDYTYDLSLHGIFSPNKYQIKFTNCDLNTLEVTYNSSFTLPTPTKAGFKFIGWMFNNTLFTKNKYEFTHDITLEAKWEEDVKQEVVLNLEAYGAKVNNTIKVDENELITLPTPELTGYVFKGWYLDNFFTKEAPLYTYVTYNQEKLYAKFEYDSENFKDLTPVTMYNQTTTAYDNISIYSKNTKIDASLYWQKIGIKVVNNKYIVSGIKSSGQSISLLGEYDYCILAYANCPVYNQFTALNIKVGDEVIFMIDPGTLEKGPINNVVHFLSSDDPSALDNVKAILKSTYESVHEVNANLNLLSVCDGYAINWISSSPTVISITGVVTIPSRDTYVTLSAYVSDVFVYSFEVLVKGNGQVVAKKLATGYIYTPYTITQNAMNQLDIIYCAFIEFNDNAEWTNLTKMMEKINQEIFPKAKLANTKVVFSINKGTSSCFSTVSASPTLREKLATNILELIKTYGFHGVDVDWEVPLDSEKQNFTLLMKAIYEKVKAYDSSLLVTTAIGGGKWQPPKYDLTNAKDYMDYVNLMTYSMTTSNSYYQNALYKSSKGATLTSCSIDESVKIYNGYGIKNNKILVGVPFYCTLQTNAGGPGSKVGTGKSIWYQTMLDSYPLSSTMKEYFDDECGVPYRYDATNKIFISYDNEKSIRLKCEYIHQNDLAGIMYWQYGQDVNDYLSNAIGKYI